MKLKFILIALFLSLFLSTFSYCQEGSYLTDWEWQIIDELWDRFDALPDWATEDDENRIYREIASKYGLTLDRLYYLEEEAYWEEMYYYYYYWY